MSEQPEVTLASLGRMASWCMACQATLGTPHEEGCPVAAQIVASSPVAAQPATTKPRTDAEIVAFLAVREKRSDAELVSIARDLIGGKDYLDGQSVSIAIGSVRALLREIDRLTAIEADIRERLFSGMDIDRQKHRDGPIESLVSTHEVKCPKCGGHSGWSDSPTCPAMLCDVCSASDFDEHLRQFLAADHQPKEPAQ